MSAPLKTSLGWLSGTAMMLNTVLGAGVLILPGLAAAEIGGQSLWTWVACAVASIPLLAMFAILASRHPEAGGVGHIAKMAFGRFGHILTSVLFLGAVFVGLPSIALTAGYYVADVAEVPAWFVAILVVAVAGSLNLAAPGLAARIGTTVAALVIAFLVVLVAAASMTVASGVVDAGAVRKASTFSAPTLTLFVPFMLVFFAFTGWEVAIGTTEEFRNPRRDVPRAVALSFAITVAFYLLCSLIVITAGPVAFNNAPFLSILSAHGAVWGMVIAAGTAGLLTANLFAALWAVSRMIFSLSREGILPGFLTASSDGTPRICVALTTALVACVASLDGFGLVNVDALFSAAGQNFLIIYIISTLALWKLAERTAERIIAVVSLAVAAAAITLSEVHIVYPLALAAFSLVVVLVSRRGKHAGVALSR